MWSDIRIEEPKPFDKVGFNFLLSGSVPKSWIDHDLSEILLDFLDVKGKTFLGASFKIDQRQNLIQRLKRTLSFSTVVGFNETNLNWIAKSQGRMAIRLSFRNNKHEIYVPLIVEALEPLSGVDPKILEMHKNIPERIRQYKVDLENYHKKLIELDSKRKHLYEAALAEATNLEGGEDITDGAFLREMLAAINKAPDNEREEIDEQYREAREWAGPLCGEEIGRINGFVIRVLSSDHGTHFHIFHQGRAINARFSFPDIRLITDCKNIRATIRSDEEQIIREFLNNPSKFQALKNALERAGRLA